MQVVGTGRGRKKAKKGAEKPGRVYESHEDPGWESEVRTREDEVAAYEERIAIKEFRERLAFNLGKVGTPHLLDLVLDVRSQLDSWCTF